MKTKMKIERQGSNELPRFAVGALAIAGASAASGATVQITFANNYVSSSSGLLYFAADLTGDSVADVTGLHGVGFADVIIASLFTNSSLAAAYASTRGAGGASWFIKGQGDGSLASGGGAGSFRALTGGGSYGMTFADSRINGGGTTFGLLDVTSSRSAGGEYKVQIHRLIFDDASTTAPTGVTSETTGLAEWSAVSAVPEASTSLGLLALGAGGLLTRRRLKRAA